MNATKGEFGRPGERAVMRRRDAVGSAALRARSRRNPRSLPGRCWEGARRDESGQALILAVVIMLLLVFLGSIFLRSVLSNLKSAEHGHASSGEYAAAEAGIRFADTNLSSSELGADWRPHASYNIDDLKTKVGPTLLQQDPDWLWIQPFDPATQMGGYVRYNLGDSRFLLRVAYNPSNDASAPLMPDVPRKADGTPDMSKLGPTSLSRYVMIEAIGRRGSAAEIDKEYDDFIANGDPIDPTVFTGGSIVGGDARFRRELIAFKAIGINNYLRFITDPERLNRRAYIGVDQTQLRDGGNNPINMPFRMGMDAGSFDGTQGVAGFAVPTGGGIHSNVPLVFVGDSDDPTNDTQPEVVIPLVDPKVAPWNVVEAPRIEREGKGQDDYGLSPYNPTRMYIALYNPADQPGTPAFKKIRIPASDDTSAWSKLETDANLADYVRDSEWSTVDPTQKQTISPRRSMARLEGPRLETIDPASRSLRYEALSKGAPGVGNGPAAAPGNGYGSGIYINNATHNRNHDNCTGQVDHDLDHLRKQWLRIGAGSRGDTSGWSGPIYTPPGVQVVIEPVDWTDSTAKDDCGLIWITRTDNLGDGWPSPDGTPTNVQTMCFELRPDPNSTNSQEYTLRPKYWDNATDKWLTWNWTTSQWTDIATAPVVRYPFNGVLYAEGNIRIRGRLPRDADATKGGVRLTVVSRGTIYIEGNLVKGDRATNAAATDPARSQIALLARDCVTLNTTQLLHVATDCTTSATGAGEPFYWRFGPNEPDRSFTVSWDPGLPPTDPRVTAYYQANTPSLFIRHQANHGASSFQWLVNNEAYQFILSSPFNSAVAQSFYALLNVGWANFADAMGKPFPVFDMGNLPTGVPANQTVGRYSLSTQAGMRNTIRIHQYDPGAAPDGTATTGGEYDLGAVAIQPLDVQISALIYAEHGSWFVIPGTYFQDTERFDPQPNAAERYPKDREPLDVQIHVVGAISEGQTASVEDVTQWTAHWRGANRSAYETGAGDTDDRDFKKRAGIAYEFDPSLITDTRKFTYGDGNVYLLPGMPRLPMCPELVYFGERPVQ